MLPDLLPLIPKEFTSYFEPMVGGGALFWRLQQMGRLVGKRVVLSDLSKPLIEAYVEIQQQPGRIAGELGLLLRDYARNPETTYYANRTAWNEGDHAPSRYVFLKQTSFNGLWRENSKGKLNSPWGHYAKPLICDLQGIAACSKALREVEVLHLRVDNLPGNPEGSLVYYDPPYYRCFDKYSAVGFSVDDHEQLVADCHLLERRGAHVLYTHEAQAIVYNWLAREWPTGRIHAATSRRYVNSAGDGRHKVGELIVASPSASC